MCDHAKFAPPRREAIDPAAPKPEPPSAVKWVLPSAAGLVGTMLLFEHREHWADIAPWLLVTGCLLLHVLMCRRHR